METTSPAFRHTLPLQLRFNDIDLLGHVNNSVYFSFYDLGKARYFETVKAQNIDWKKADVVVANVNADFLSPIYPSHHQADAGTVSCQPAGDQYLRPLRAIPA